MINRDKDMDNLCLEVLTIESNDNIQLITSALDGL